jgi:hypothetical protein
MGRIFIWPGQNPSQRGLGRIFGLIRFFCILTPHFFKLNFFNYFVQSAHNKMSLKIIKNIFAGKGLKRLN